MPALDNPRWERFAQAIVEGLANGDRKPYTQGRAYIAAGYIAKDAGVKGGSAEVCSARLLKKVQPILQRVKELQAEANKRLEPEVDRCRQRIGKRPHTASLIAEEQKNPASMVAAELGLAKVFHSIRETDEPTHIDFTTAKSMTDIGRKLLQSVGFKEPDDVSIQAAIAANDAFIARLEAIRDSAQGLTLVHVPPTR